MSSTCPNKEWMSARLLSEEYVKGAKAFIRFTWENIGKDVDWYCCPCLKCHLDVKNTAKVMYEHIICNGIDSSYTRWVHHGEPFPRNNVGVPSNTTSIGNQTVASRVEDMVNDIFGHSHPDHLNACLDEVHDDGSSQVMDDLGENDQNNSAAENHDDSEENTKYNSVAAPYKKIAEREKRKREDTEAKYDSLTQRLDEESAARKILEERLMPHIPTSSTFDSYNQERCSPAFDGSPIFPTSSHCLLLNFKKKPVALGAVPVRRDETTNDDLCRVRIDDIYDYETDLFEEDGKLGDISVCSTITWPKVLVKII